MLFTSIIFFLFLAFSVLVYYLLPVKLRNHFLIIISLLFYAYAGIGYTFLIVLLIVVNYLIGLGISNAENKRKKFWYLYLSLFINLGVLIFFKYWNFAIQNLFDFLGWLHLDTSSMPFLDIALPLGLSYYIFQTIGYITDVYRGYVKAERSISRFSLFTLFFPKLLVGPIERANNFLPQLTKEIYFDKQNLIEGSKRIVWGLFKKLVVADRISIYHSAIITSSQNQSGETILFACILYTFQVYADFSGYTDIALGTAKMFGFDLMENFKRPLFAKNISDFWRRWHISLSSWVNDYIFNPIVLQKRNWGVWGVFYGLLISFVVIGIWHGASWNYVLFGLLQAFAIIYEVITRKARKRISKKINPAIYDNISILLTFLFITFSLIIFQSETIDDAVVIIKGIFSNKGGISVFPSAALFMIIGCVLMLIYDLQEEYKIWSFSLLSNKSWIIRELSYAFLLIYIVLAGVFDGGQFIYFAF